MQKDKDTILCVGLDPALPEQRQKQVISWTNVKIPGENEVRLKFCLEIIDETKEYCCSFKPNQQYVAGFTRKEHNELTDAIRKADALSILDYKLNDIGDTVESALFHLHRWGYDAVTFSPLLGNLRSTVEAAHGLTPDIGIIVLTLTSNPESVRYQKEAAINGKPLYQIIAEDVKKCGGDGCVVGATGHVKEDEIRLIRQIVGDDKILLVPGVGAQKGDPEKIIRTAGKNILINVGRDIIYSDQPSKRAEQYQTLFSEIREKFSKDLSSTPL